MKELYNKVKYWSTSRIIKEIKDINWQIEQSNYGKWELYYRDMLYEILGKRGVVV